jgi:outer membrane protein TolC
MPAPIALAVLALAGCATSAVDLAPPRADAPWVPTTNATGAIQPGPAASSGGAGYVLPPNPTLAAIPPPPPIDPNRSYSLPELIDIAESNNPRTRIAWDEARSAALAAGIAENSYLPNITASAVGAYQDSSVQNSTLGLNTSGNEQAHGVISAISLNWLLFDFGERRATIEAAKQISVISNIAFTQVHQQVIYNVSLAFYAYAAARARAVSAVQSLANAQAVQAAAKARHAHGVGTVVDAAQAGQATAQAKLAVVQANGGVQDAYLSLLNAMGISPLTKMRVADLAPRRLSPALDTPVHTIVAEALARRPDMLSAYAAQQASLANVRAAQAEFLPKIFLSATGAYNSGGLNVTSIPAIGQQAATGNISGTHLGGTILAGVTFPLYDGGTRAAVLAQTKASADSADAALDQARDAATRQVVGAENALQTSLAAYSASQSLVSAAKTTYDAALTAYQNGVGSITDATLAETQRLQAQNAATDAYSAALSAAATLAFTTGALGAAPP